MKGTSFTEVALTRRISDLAMLDPPVVVLRDLLAPLLHHGDLPLVHVGEADLQALFAIVNSHRLQEGGCQMLLRKLTRV